MKNNMFKTALVLVLVLTIASFTSIKEKKIDIIESNVTWQAYKVTGKHSGSINLKKGALNFNGKDLIGGNFVMDMTSLNVTDLEGEWKDKLVGHLKSNDFFSTEKHPTSTLVLTNVDGENVTADLTIKGITNSINFIMKISENSATAELKIDRTKFDIKYNSASFFDNLKDRAISDEFDLNVNLMF